MHASKTQDKLRGTKNQVKHMIGSPKDGNSHKSSERIKGLQAQNVQGVAKKKATASTALNTIHSARHKGGDQVTSRSALEDAVNVESVRFILDSGNSDMNSTPSTSDGRH